MKCEYDYNPHQIRTSDIPPSQASPVLPDTACSSLTTAGELLSKLSRKQKSTVLHSSTVPSQVLGILIADNESVPAVLATFFRTIDTWVPIIELEECQIRLRSMVADDNVELASLFLSIYLITRPCPTQSSGAVRTASTLYFQAKAIHNALMSIGKPSIDLVKSGLLIATYEQGQNLQEAAQMTIFSCSRMAIQILGNEQGLRPDGDRKSELDRLWWTIVMVDR